MLTIVVQVDRPPGQAIGIKEEIAMLLEPLGDVRIISVEAEEPKQITWNDLMGRGGRGSE